MEEIAGFLPLVIFATGHVDRPHVDHLLEISWGGFAETCRERLAFEGCVTACDVGRRRRGSAACLRQAGGRIRRPSRRCGRSGLERPPWPLIRKNPISSQARFTWSATWRRPASEPWRNGAISITGIEVMVMRRLLSQVFSIIEHSSCHSKEIRSLRAKLQYRLQKSSDC